MTDYVTPNRSPADWQDGELKTKNLKPGRYCLGRGLWFVVTPNGRQFSRRYRDAHGSDRVEKIGDYPAMKLAQARQWMNDRAASDDAGITVTAQRKPSRSAKERAATLEAIRQGRDKSRPVTAAIFGEWVWEYVNGKSKQWTPDYAASVKARVERYLETVPTLWFAPMAKVGKSDVSPVLDAIHDGTHIKSEGPAPTVAVMTRQLISGAAALADSKGAVVRPLDGIKIGTGETHESKPQPAVTSAGELRALIEAMHADTRGRADIRAALWAMALMAQRPCNIRRMRWDQLHLDAPRPFWHIPRQDMKIKGKTRPDHVLYLHPETVKFLKSQPKTSPFVFVGKSKTGQLVTTSVRAYLRDVLNYRGKMVLHGWRSAFKTWAKNQLKADGSRVYEKDAYDSALDHTTENGTGQRYDRTEHMQRAEFIATPFLDWQAYLHGIATGEAPAPALRIVRQRA